MPRHFALQHQSLIRPVRVSAAWGLAGSLAFLALGATTASATGLIPPRNPAGNIAASPNFLSSGTCSGQGSALRCQNPCVSIAVANSTRHAIFPPYTNTPTCDAYVLRAYDAARAAEGLAPLVLPTNWYSLNVPEQLFVLVDLERTARGLPAYLGLNRALSASAQRAARTKSDPKVATGFRVGLDAQHAMGIASAWGAGPTTLEVQYFWMYVDGWGGATTSTPNESCYAAKAPGCWAHRDQLLGFDPGYSPGVGLRCAKCEMGAGFAVVNGTGSYTDLVELPAGRPPAMYFTWARDVVPFLTVSNVATTTIPPG